MSRKEKIFNLIYWLGLLGVLLFAHYRNPFDSDEGLILDGAWNLLNGRELYTDFFEFIPPGSFYLVWLIIKIFSVNYFPVKVISLLIFLFGAMGVFQISKKLSPSKLNYLPPFILITASFFWPIINHNIYNLTLLIWSTYFFINYLQNKLNRDLIFSGLIAGLSLLFLQQKGLAIIFAQGMFLIYYSYPTKTKNIFKQVSIYSAAALTPLVLLFLKWSPTFLYETLISFVLQNYIDVNKMSYTIMNFFLLTSLIAAIILKSQKSFIVHFLLWLQFCLLLTTFSRPDNYHVVLVLFPLFSLIPSIIKERWGKINPIFTYLEISLIGSILFCLVFPSVFFIATNPPRGKSNPLYNLVDYIKENCPRENDLYTGPFIPGLYFETAKLNPTPYYILLTGFQNENFFAETKKHLEENSPRCIVMNYQIVEKFHYNKNNLVDNYIRENYQLTTKFFDDEVYIKK